MSVKRVEGVILLAMLYGIGQADSLNQHSMPPGGVAEGEGLTRK